MGRYGGQLSTVRPDDLAAVAVGAVVERAGVDPADVDDVILGCANQAGEDNRDVARMAALLAGFPVEVPGQTVNRLCGSGMQAAIAGAREIRDGAAEVIVAGGVESMSRVAVRDGASPRPASRAARQTLEDTALGWRLVNPKMVELGHTATLGETAENVAARYGVDARRPGRVRAAQPPQRARRAGVGRAGRGDRRGRGRRSQGRRHRRRRRRGTAHRRRAGAAARAAAGVQRRRHGDGRQRLAAQRRRGGAAADVRCRGPAARPDAAGALRRRRLRRRRPVLHGDRPGAGDAQAARAARADGRRRRPRRGQRGVRRAGGAVASASWASTPRSSTSTAARSRSATRSAPAERG